MNNTQKELPLSSEVYKQRFQEGKHSSTYWRFVDYIVNGNIRVSKTSFALEPAEDFYDWELDEIRSKGYRIERFYGVRGYEVIINK